MSAWDLYKGRIDAYGGTRQNTTLLREERTVDRKAPNSLSYFTVEMYPAEHCYNLDSDNMSDYQYYQNVAIINSDNLNEKTIISLPHEDIILGSLIYWMDNYWLVIERDANTVVYTKAKMKQCNYLLKWITSENEIIKQWCIVEDSTKYLSGDYEDKDFFTTRGDTRLYLQIAKNKYTVVFDRNNRFLIDDDLTPHKLAYSLTKPLKVGVTYNNQGTFSFVLQEVTATADDNHELGIADYYTHFPPPPHHDDLHPEISPKQEEEIYDDEEKKGRRLLL